MNERSLRPGEKAIVLRPPAFARPFEAEGCGRLLAPLPHSPSLWRVQMFGERLSCIRVVHGGVFQTHIAHILSALNDHYQAHVDPTLLIDPINPFSLRR